MDQHRSAEGVEHLQAAARELVLAARSFLEVVDELVEDRERFAATAGSIIEFVRDGLGGGRPPTSHLEDWERAAWAAPAAATDPPTGGDDSAAEASEPTPTEGGPGAAAGTAEPLRATTADPRRPPRVRRIAVD